jgi:hypothetical protein
MKHTTSAPAAATTVLRAWLVPPVGSTISLARGQLVSIQLRTAASVPSFEPLSRTISSSSSSSCGAIDARARRTSSRRSRVVVATVNRIGVETTVRRLHPTCRTG